MPHAGSLLFLSLLDCVRSWIGLRVKAISRAESDRDSRHKLAACGWRSERGETLGQNHAHPQLVLHTIRLKNLNLTHL
jgi:hypothetical protein